MARTKVGTARPTVTTDTGLGAATTARPALVPLPPISENEKSRKNLPAPEYWRNAP